MPTLKKGVLGDIKYSKGHERGIDIKATKEDKTLIIEAKGAKGDPKSPVTKKSKFSSGDIKTHFGKAIVKLLEEKNKDSSIDIAIAEPNDDYMRKILKYVIPEIKKIGIKLFWVSKDGNVEEDF